MLRLKYRQCSEKKQQNNVKRNLRTRISFITFGKNMLFNGHDYQPEVSIGKTFSLNKNSTKMENVRLYRRKRKKGKQNKAALRNAIINSFSTYIYDCN